MGGIPMMVKAPLELFFFFSVLITLGTSLECETCINLGNNCSGNLTTCATGLDTCAVGFTETTLGARTYEFTLKGCTSSEICDKGPVYANYGLVKVRGSVVCCNGSVCEPESPKLPPRNITANGKQCPACCSLGSPCVAEVAYCTGSEDYCLEAQLQDAAGLLPVGITAKGCVSAQICTGFEGGLNSLGIVTEALCQPADKKSPTSVPPTSGSPTSGSPTSGYIILVLMVMKVFL